MRELDLCVNQVVVICIGAIVVVVCVCIYIYIYIYIKREREREFGNMEDMRSHAWFL